MTPKLAFASLMSFALGCLYRKTFYEQDEPETLAQQQLRRDINAKDKTR